MIAELGPILRSLSRRKSVFALVVAELASGFTVISCLMMACSYYLQLGALTSGHNESDLVQVTVQRPAPALDPAAARAAARAQVDSDMSRLRQLPDVVAVAQVSVTMLDQRWTFPTRVAIDDSRPRATADRSIREPVHAWTVMASPELSSVVTLQTLEGALPAAALAPAGQEQVLITRCLRDRLFKPGEPAVGRRLLFDDAPASRVAAVIEDVHVRMPFMPSAHCAAFHFGVLSDEREAMYLVRTKPDRREQAAGAVQALFGASSSSQWVTVVPFDSSAGVHAAFVRGLVVILSIMGVTVGLLALLGALAVSSFLVAERTRQIGIRRALGATRRDVIRYFLVENALATLLGTAVGLLMTACLYLAMRKVFLGIQLSPKLLLLTGALLWIDATLAAMIPARRAAQIPPSVASRAASAA
jgi:putative ABC transport system permease protein